MRHSTLSHKGSSRPTSRRWLLIAALALSSIALFWLASPASPLASSIASGEGDGKVDAPTTSPRTPRFKRIDQVRVGERVALIQNPTGEFDASLGYEVDPPRWRKLTLRAPKIDGTWCDVELLRPVWWIQERSAQAGGTVYISVPECGIDGNAEILSIGPCPTLQPGTGPVVIGTFRHQSANILDLYVEGQAEPIGVTANHPFWSDDRQMSSGELKAASSGRNWGSLVSVVTRQLDLR